MRLAGIAVGLPPDVSLASEPTSTSQQASQAGLVAAQQSQGVRDRRPQPPEERRLITCASYSVTSLNH
jgi:hypothetical protein